MSKLCPSLEEKKELARNIHRILILRKLEQIQLYKKKRQTPGCLSFIEESNPVQEYQYHHRTIEPEGKGTDIVGEKRKWSRSELVVATILKNRMYSS